MEYKQGKGDDMLKHGILGLLNYGNMTGYEIMIVFRDSLSYFWQAQTSQIYRELQVLEKNGWIQSNHIEQNNKPDKNLLSITDAGRKELKKWLQEDESKGMIRNQLLLKTFFRGECSIDENIEYFKSIPKNEQVFPDGTNELIEKNRKYQQGIGDPLKALYWKFTVDFGLMYEKMLKDWSENCLHELEEIKNCRR